MIVNLKDSKARLSELVEVASQGEDVLITVRGKVKARLTRAPEIETPSSIDWAEELTANLERQPLSGGRPLGEWLDLDREERNF